MSNWVLPSIVSGILAFVLALLLVLVRNRRSLLTYHVTHNRIGISTHDNIHGEVSVSVGGNPMQNLYMSNIWLVNRSMRDVQDLDVKVYTGTDHMTLLSEQTHIEGTVEVLSHTAEYEKIKNQLRNSIAEIEELNSIGDHIKAGQIQRSQADNWRIWNSQRWYRVPVLGRGQTIRFTYMTNLPFNDDPVIYISCQKAGVRVKYKQPYQPVWHLWGVPLGEAALTGIAIGVVIWLVVASSLSNLWLATLICLVAGVLSNIPGAGVVKFYKWLRDKLIG